MEKLMLGKPLRYAHCEAHCESLQGTIPLPPTWVEQTTLSKLLITDRTHKV